VFAWDRTRVEHERKDGNERLDAKHFEVTMLTRLIFGRHVATRCSRTPRSLGRKWLATVAVVAAAAGLSPDALASNAWKSGFPVHSIVAHPFGFILILEASDPACGPSGNQFYVQAGLNSQTADGVKSILAVAMLALSTGRTVNALVDTAISGCPVQQLQLNP
jgi:hypothetical protein